MYNLMYAIKLPNINARHTYIVIKE
jgi:hypothetical protein